MASVDVLIADARGFAKESYGKAQEFVSAAVNAIEGIDTSFYVDGGRAPSDPPITPLAAFVPDFQLAGLVLPPAPGPAPQLNNLPSLDVGQVPVNLAKNPGFTEPALPAPLHALNFTAPNVNTNFTFPNAPALLSNLNIDLPTLQSYTAPTAPVISVPAFDGVRPTDDITPPTDYADKYVKAYRDIAPGMISALDAQLDGYLNKYNPQYKAQLAALEDRIATYIKGGTALTAAVENALYERGRDKNNAEYRRTRDAAFTDAAKRGLTIPDGALYNAVQQARQNAADNNARTGVEITVKQAELEQQNIQFAMSTSASLRTGAMSAALSYHSSLVQLNGQALSYAQAILTSAIEVYNAFVKAFEVKLEAYKVDASVYETRLRAVQTLVDIYRAEIQALEALTRVDMVKIEAFKARIEALSILAGVYRTEVETVQAKAQVERLKIEIFGEQVRAYATEAQAKNAEWQGYSAAVGGQEARIRAYGEEIRAFGAQVEAYRAVISAKQTEVQSITSYNSGLIAQYTAGVEAYRSRVSAAAQVQSAGIEYQKVKLFAFQARVSAEEAQARLYQERYRTAATLQVQNFQAVATSAVEAAKLRTQQIEAVTNTTLAGAKVYEGIAQSALQGMNTLVTANAA